MDNEVQSNTVYIAAKGVMKGRPHYLLLREICKERKEYHVLSYTIRVEGIKDLYGEIAKEIEKNLPGLQYERDFLFGETQEPLLFQLFFLRPLEEYMYLGLGKGDYCWLTEDKLKKITSPELFPTLDHGLTMLPNELIHFLGKRYTENLKTALGKIVDASIRIEGIEKAYVSYLAAGLRRMLMNHVSGLRIGEGELSCKLKKPQSRNIHRYETTPGIQETTREVFSNLEKIRLRPKGVFEIGSEGKSNTLEINGEEGPVYAKDLFHEIDTEIEVINGDQIVLHRNGLDGSVYTIHFRILSGVWKDFSPVKIVGYKIEGLDGSDTASILMNIVTDGSRSVAECYSEILTCLGGDSNESN